MKRLNSRISNAGFSLVELMVVVAIIGILAAVAIPNYTKFQRRARAAEGKTMLSAIYDGEKSSFASYEGYSTNFAIMGFAPEGQNMRTNAGFNGACAGPLATGISCEPSNMAVGEINNIAYTQAQTVITEANAYDIKHYCPAAVTGTGVAPCKIDASAATEAVSPPTSSGAVSNNPATGAYTFKAASVTDCGSTTADNWWVDENKTFTQVADCTMAN